VISFIPTLFAAAEAEEAGIAALGIDPLALLAQAGTFLVLFFVIKKFALSKIVKVLDERHQTINRGLHLTSEMDKLKAELDERVEKVLREARKEADAIVAEARTESGEIIKAAEQSASRKADAILKDAEGKIERDIADARAGLRAEVAGLVAEVSEAVLREKVDASKDRAITEKYLKEVL
jgi:F-type H+-transporting ATPase subunit b